MPQLSQPLDTIADLEGLIEADRVRADKDTRHDQYQMSYLSHGYIAHSTMHSQGPENGIYYQLAGHFARRQPLVFANQEEIMPILESNWRIVLLGFRINLLTRRFLYASTPVHIATEPLEVVFLSWPVRKRSPLTEPFNLV